MLQAFQRSTRSVMLAAALLTAAPPPRGQAPARTKTELLAADIERELAEINGSLAEKRERLLLETAASASLAAVFEKYASNSPEVALFATRSAPRAPGSREESSAQDEAMKPWLEQREAMAALELKSALLADELQRYKETGVLSPTPTSTAENFKRLVENSWTLPASAPEVPALDLDLVKLQRQLRRYEMNLRPRPAERRPPTQSFPAPVGRSLPSSSRKLEAAQPLFERDAGRGTPESDPVPELIVLLSSTEARGRALAADELGSNGASATPAIPALRRALSDPDHRVRASAALALGAVGDPRPDVVAGLELALRDPDEEVRLSARAALRRLERR